VCVCVCVCYSQRSRRAVILSLTSFARARPRPVVKASFRFLRKSCPRERARRGRQRGARGRVAGWDLSRCAPVTANNGMRARAMCVCVCLVARLIGVASHLLLSPPPPPSRPRPAATPPCRRRRRRRQRHKARAPSRLARLRLFPILSSAVEEHAQRTPSPLPSERERSRSRLLLPLSDQQQQQQQQPASRNGFVQGVRGDRPRVRDQPREGLWQAGGHRGRGGPEPGTWIRVESLGTQPSEQSEADLSRGRPPPARSRSNARALLAQRGTLSAPVAP
jgi:hypothetical protein